MAAIQEQGGIFIGSDVHLCPDCRAAYQNGISIRTVKDFLSLLCERCLAPAEKLFAVQSIPKPTAPQVFRLQRQRKR